MNRGYSYLETTTLIRVCCCPGPNKDRQNSEKSVNFAFDHNETPVSLSSPSFHPSRLQRKAGSRCRYPGRRGHRCLLDGKARRRHSPCCALHPGGTRCGIGQYHCLAVMGAYLSSIRSFLADYSPSLTLGELRGKILVLSRNEYTGCVADCHGSAALPGRLSWP